METKVVQRKNGRAFNAIRPLSVTRNILSHAPSSVLIELGNTKVLCAVTLQQGVPFFLKGKGTGWLTAEYALLPTATETRTSRDVFGSKQNGRTVEISRVIGRSLRTVVDLSVIGERTLYIDCDVLQADGGTRVASLLGASLALVYAQESWLASGLIMHPFMKDEIIAVSIGVQGKDTIIIDPDYQEDQMMHADFNVIMTKSGKLIEIQGGSEKEPISFDLFNKIRDLAVESVGNIAESLQKIDSAVVMTPYTGKSENSKKTVGATREPRGAERGKKESEFTSKSSIFSLSSR